MAIIYTYPDLGAVDGSEKLLVSDGNDLNNTKTITTAAYGAYINATYGGGSGTSIYKADGSIIANRQLSGQSLYSLTLASLTSFTVSTSGAINLGAVGDINVDSTDIAFSNTNGIKSLPNPTNNKVYWDASQNLWVKSHYFMALTSATGGIYVGNSAAEYLEINNGIPLLTGVGNSISDITAAKNLTTKEWVEDYVANWVGSTNITTLGTITAGTWNGATIAQLYGGTGFSSYSTGDILYASAANTLSKLTVGSANQVLTVSGGVPTWQASTAADSIYTADGSVAAGRVATIADDLTWTGGRIKRIANSINIVEVTQASDLPATLIANTTYVIRGTITTATAITVSSGNAVIGLNRTIDNIVYTGTGNLFTVTDQDFSIRNLGLKATNATGKVLDATNITAAAADNNGRTKVLELQNLLISGSTNVWTIRGFELVDVGNCLFWYIHGGTIGCQFQSCRHLEISSCEFYSWYELGIPANIDLYRLIEILPNLYSVGNGIVNINSSIVHPETIQYGLWVSNDANPLLSSTTGFGTISSNTFTDTNLTTGRLAFLDYDDQNTYIIQANQGLLNGNAKGTLSIVGNLNDLDTGTTNPQILKPANIATGAFTSTPTFPVSTRVITSVPNCSFTYNNKNDGNFFVVITGTVEMSGDGFIACRVRSGGVAIPFAIGYPEIRQGRAQSFTFSVIGSAVLGDVFDVEFEAYNTSGVSTANDILVREFVLNGYQF